MNDSCGGSDAHVYAYKPSLFRAPLEFRLTPTALDYTIGSQPGRIALRDVRRIRLSYRPTSVQTSRYLAEIWPVQGGKLQIASTSRRTMMDATRHDEAYATFVRDLATRVAAANPTVEFEAGTSPLVYWPGLAVFVLLALAIATLAVRAIQVEQWTGAAVIGGFWLLFLWQIGTFFRRNRPRRFGGGDIPADALPTPLPNWRRSG
jgi:hypothetical protein